MKKRGLLVVMIILIMTSWGFSQDWKGQGRQIGYVYDEKGNPLEGVKVKLFYVKTQSSFEITTDVKGKWVANGVKGGTWWIDFDLPGYEPKKISAKILDFRQKNAPIEIRMKKIEGLYITDDLKEDFIKANSLFDEGNYEEAIGLYERVVKKFPDAYIVNLNIGHSYFQMEKYDEAESFYQKVLENDPKHVQALMGVGNCYTNRGDNNKALEWYGKIEFEKIDDSIVLFNVGTIFYNNSKFDDALRYYSKAVKIQEDFLDARYQLGLTYLALGENPEALKEFEAYLNYDSDSERASQVKNFIEYLRKR